MPLKPKFMTLKAKYKFGIYIFNVLLGHLISLHACTWNFRSYISIIDELEIEESTFYSLCVV